MADRQVTYDIKFNTDTASLQKLQNELLDIQNMTKEQYFSIKGIDAASEDLVKVKTTASQVKTALENSFNVKLNTFDMQSFNNQLKVSGQTLKSIKQDFVSLGTTGQAAFIDLTNALLTVNTQAVKTKSFLESIGDTLLNAAKWSVAYGAINNISNGIKSAWNYAVSLDSALNDIRIVTGQSYEDMERFATSANKAAKALGTTTKNYTKGALIYYQQGLSEKDVLARTEVTAKAANVTGQSMQEVSEQLTAVWNGYKVAANEAEAYVDKLAAVAASSASDLEELSTAMSRVASSASTMGIDIDQLTAQIATIESVTRQDAASIGTALKTIYSRMGDLAVGAEDEFGVALGDVSGKMKQMGIDILDSEGNMRSMGTVIEEVAAKWNTWTSAQQQAAAVALAGKRQYNNLFALFENWDMYEANKTISENSLGELQKEQDTYMESTAAHIKQLNTALDKIKESFFENKRMNNLIDALTQIADVVDGIVQSLGGGANILLQVSAIVTKIYSGKIAQGMSSFVKTMRQEVKGIFTPEEQDAARKNLASQYGLLYDENTVDKENDITYQTVSRLLEIDQQRNKYASILTKEEKNRYDDLMNQVAALGKQKLLYQDITKIVSDSVSSENTSSLEGRRSEIEGVPGSKKMSLLDKADRDSKAIADYTDEKEAGQKKFAKDAAKRLVSSANREATLISADMPETSKTLSDALTNLQAIMGQESEIDVDTLEKREALLKVSEALTEAYKKEAEALKDRIAAANNGNGLTFEQISKMSADEKQNLVNSAEARKDFITGSNGLRSQNTKNNNIVSAYGINSDISKDKATASSKAILKAAQDEIKLGKLTIEQKKVLEEAINKVNVATQNGTKINLEDEDVKKSIINLSGSLKKAYGDEAKNCDALIEALTKLGMSYEDAKQMAEKFDAEQKQLAKAEAFTLGCQKFTEGVSLIVSAYSTMSSLVSQIKQTIDVLNDDTASGGEKFKAILGIMIGTLMTFSSVVSVIMPTIKNIIVNNTKEIGEQGAKEAAAANAKITAALGWIGLILAAISAITALIIAVASAVGSQETALEKAQKDYEAAKETLEAMTSALQVAKENYASLGETIDKYKSARDNIDNLKAGTDEFKDAVYEANLQALELINTYDILSQYASFNKNGILTIDEAGFNALLDQKKEDLAQQQLSVLYQQQGVNLSNLKKEVAEVLTGAEIYFKIGYGSYHTTEKDTLHLLPMISDVINALIQNQDINKQEIVDVIKNSFEAGDSDSNVRFSNLTEETSKKIDELLEKVPSLLKNIETNTEGIKNKILSNDSKNYSNTLNKDAYSNLVAARATNSGIKDFYTGVGNIINANRGGGVGGNFTLKDEDIATQLFNAGKITEAQRDRLSEVLIEKGMSTGPDLLAKIFGVDSKQISVQRTKGGGAAFYVADEDGNKTEISASTIENIFQTQLGTIFADEFFGAEFREFINTYTKGIKGGKDSRGAKGVYADIFNLTGGNTSAHFNDTTLADLNTLNQRDKNGNLTIPQEILDQWQDFGFGSKEDFIKAYTDAIETSLSAINDSQEKLKSYGSSVIGNYTEEEYKSIVDGYDKVFSQWGFSGVQKLDEFLQQFSEEEVPKITKAFSEIDLNSITNLSDFITQLEKLGIEVDVTDEKWQNMFETLKENQKIFPEILNNFNNIRETLASIKELTKDLSVGDIISDETYQALKKINPLISQFFVQVADGYKMVSGSNEEISSILKTPYKNMEDVIESYKQAEDFGNKYKDTVINTDTTNRDLMQEVGLKFFGSSTSSRGHLDRDEIDANYDDLKFLAETAGVSVDKVIQLLTTDASKWEEEDNELIQKVFGVGNDIVNRAANGELSRAAALKRWGIDVSASYGEVNQAYKDGKFGNLEDEKEAKEAKKVYDEIRSSYVADWANEYGLSVDVINKLSKNGENDFDMLKKLEFLQTYEKTISELQNTAQYLTGDALAENLKAQNEQLENAKKIKDEIIAAQKEELDVTGKSYDQILQAYQENAGNLTADQQAKYEALLSTMEESADLSNTISDNLISAADAIIEASQESTDNLKFWSEFNRKYMENGKFKGGWAAQSELSIKDRFEISEDNLKADLRLIKDYDEEISKLENKLTDKNRSEADLAKYKQQLDEFKKGRAEAIESYYDDVEELYSAWSDGWDLVNSKLEDHISRLEKINELYDGIMTLNKIVDKNYFSQDLLDRQVANSLTIAQTRYRQVQELQKQLETKGLTEEQRAEIETVLAEAAASAMTAYSDYFEKLKTAAQAELNNIFDQRGITEASERWERQKTYDDQYLNVADAQLNINKIQKNYKSAIENASSLAAQTQLRVKMEAELNKLQANRNKLTQYEVDRANAVYELTLKQIALEESQRNASKMKLTRDANGNLTYAFAQDQDAAAAAQAELEEAQNNLFNIDNDELRSRIDKYYQYQSEAQSALAQALADGDTERYNELYKYYYGDNGLITVLQASLGDVNNNLENSFKEIFPEGSIEALSSYAESTKIQGENIQEMANEIKTVGEDFASNVGTLKDLLKDSEEGKGDGLISQFAKIADALQPNEEDENNLNNQIKDIKGYLNKIATALDNVKKDINSAANKDYNGKSFFPSSDGVLVLDENQTVETPKIDSKIPTAEDVAKSKNISTPGLGTVTDISVGPIDSDKILSYPGSWNNNSNYPSSDKVFSNINSNNSAKTTNNSITITNNFPNATDANGVIEAMGGQINMFIDDPTK